MNMKHYLFLLSQMIYSIKNIEELEKLNELV